MNKQDFKMFQKFATGSPRYSERIEKIKKSQKKAEPRTCLKGQNKSKKSDEINQDKVREIFRSACQKNNIEIR